MISFWNFHFLFYMIYQNKVYFVLILFSRKLAKFYFSTDFVEFFKCTISLVKNKIFYFSLQSLYFCYCFILHRVGSEVQGWLEKIIMGTPILHFISKRMFSNFQVWCLLWTPFIKWATWMNIWGKNLRKVRVRSLRRDVLWTFEKHQEGQCGRSWESEGSRGYQEMESEGQNTATGSGQVWLCMTIQSRCRISASTPSEATRHLSAGVHHNLTHMQMNCCCAVLRPEWRGQG